MRAQLYAWIGSHENEIAGVAMGLGIIALATALSKLAGMI